MAEKQVKRRRSTAIKPRVGSQVEPVSGHAAAPEHEERRRLIADAAHFRAERRGIAAGGELDDWLAAEAETDRLAEMGGSRSRHSAHHM
jgi:hypothetical protein